MKLALGILGVATTALFLGGCGPGLSHQGKWAKAPSVPDAVGTTTLTSAPQPLPAWLPDSPTSLPPIASWEEELAPAAPQTWGKAPEGPTPEQLAEYGF